MRLKHASLALFLCLSGLTPAPAQETQRGTAAAPSNVLPDLHTLLSPPVDGMQLVTQRYEADRGNLTRRYAVMSPSRFARLKLFYNDWFKALAKLDASKLGAESRSNYTRLNAIIQRELEQLDAQAKAQAEIAPLVSFAPVIYDLEDSRRKMDTLNARKAADMVDSLKKLMDHARHTMRTPLDSTLAGRAADTTATLRTNLRNWFEFYNHYDPLFDWWLAQPYKEADAALQDYISYLKDQASHVQVEVGWTETAHTEPPADMPVRLEGKEPEVPDLVALMSVPQSEMRDIIQRFQGARGGRGGRGSGGGRGGGGRGGGFGGGRGPAAAPSKQYYRDWLAALEKLDFDALNRESQVDYLLLKKRIQYQLLRADQPAAPPDRSAHFIPFEPAIAALEEAQRAQAKPDVGRATNALAQLKRDIETAREGVEPELSNPAAATTNATSLATAARNLGTLRTRLGDWHDENNTADPKWGEAVADSFKAADQALADYATFLREKSGTTGSTARRDGSDIVGRPIGRNALMVELAGEMIPYTPEEIIAIGEKEFAWCEAEMKKASRQMGYGDDWHKALEKVKTMHVEPGQQPYEIRDLAWQAEDYLESHKLITVPEIARETWGMEMMSPQRQLVNPFFTGGALISVSFPTDTMSHEAKIQSMRGNNNHFSHATVFHELIPGHNLQGYMSARYNPQRRGFGTAFWGEGWAVYWELFLYDRGFDKSPEDRIGALFWRMHRCARIIFSLNFHLGKWTPQQCIDFLVDRVGHERDNATGEVRRSFGGGYGPLYQAAYLLGALQLRALHHELVDSGKMTNRAFHDAVIQGGSMPITMVRARLSPQKLTRDYPTDWKFYGPKP